MNKFNVGDLRVQITDKGFCLNKLSDKDEYEIDANLLFGDITCKYLNEEYFKRHIVKNNDLDKVFEELGPPIIEIVTDRKGFASKFSIYSLLVTNRISVTYFYDINLNKGVEILTASDWKDLLGCDLCKVLENNILIKRCECCKAYFPTRHPRAKYCKEHQAEGAKRTKYKNLADDRCATLAKQIYNRLYRNEEYHAQDIRTYDRFAEENREFKQNHKDGLITEQDYYNWLVVKDGKTRKRKYTGTT